MTTDQPDPSFPLHWTVATRFSADAPSLRPKALTWPGGAAPVMTAFPLAFERLDDWAERIPDLVLFDTADPGELRALSAQLGEGRGAALAIVSGAAAEAAAMHAAPNLTCVPRGASAAALLSVLARETDALISRTICSALLASRLPALARQEEQVRQLAPVFHVPAATTVPPLPPLESVFSAHARSLGGSWWDRQAKLARHLDVSEKTARDYRERAPVGIERVRSPTPSPLRLWIVDDDAARGQDLAGPLAAALASSGIGVAPTLITSPLMAKLEARRHPLPEMVVADLQRLGTGLLVRELFARGTGPVLLALPRTVEQLAREAAQVHALRELRADVEALRAELAPMPLNVGDPDTTIDALKKSAVAAALLHHASLDAAARCLAVNPRTVARWR